MKIKRWIATALVIALSSSVAACSNTDSDNTQSGGNLVPENLIAATNFDVLVGEMLPLSANTPSDAAVLVNNSGMSGLWAPNHMHAAFDSSTEKGAEYVKENMYFSAEATQLIFDLGTVQAAGAMFIWNYNDISNLGSGMKDINIMYSPDGTNWTDYGNFELAQSSLEDATAYGGTVASNTKDGNPINFCGAPMRYLCITPISNHGGNGFGLSEIRLFRQKTHPSSGDMLTFEAFTPQADGDNPENVANNLGMNGLSGTVTSNETHSANAGDMWLSKESAENSLLVFNLDGTYPIDSMKLWNYNASDSLDNGIKGFEIFYTTGEACNTQNDGTGDYLDFNGGRWQSLGRYSLPKASGNDGLEASLTIDFGGKHAQHIKIVPINNHGGDGFGLSEVRIYTAAGWAVEPSRTWTGLLSSSGTFKYQGNLDDDPFADKDNGSGWIGADGIMSTSLNSAQIPGSITSDSKTMFTFQDTYHGNFGNYDNFDPHTHGFGAASGFNIGMKNMSYLFLSGNTPDPRNVQFYLTLNNDLSKDHPLNNILPDSYWISDSTVINGIVYTLANRFSGLATLGVDFYAQYLDPDTGFVDMNQVATTVGTEVQMDVDGCNFEAIYEEGDYIYQYGRKDGKLIVRRFTVENYPTLSSPEYYTYTGWGTDASKIKQISNYDVGNEANVTYMSEGPFAGKYINAYTRGSIWGSVSIGISDSITGPFKKLSDISDCNTIYWATERYKVHSYSYFDSNVIYGQWNYNAKAQAAISKADELLITYHFGLHDDRVPGFGFFSAVAKEYEHPTFISLVEIK